MSLLRLMVLGTGFVGAAWYILSGGANYTAGAHGVTVFASVSPSRAAPYSRSYSDVKAPDTRAVLASNQVAVRPANADSLTSLSETDAISSSVVSTSFVPVQRTLDAENKKQLAAMFATPAQDGAIQVPIVKSSFSEGAATPETQISPIQLVSPQKLAITAPNAEYRLVTGGSVNLRQGPGTNHAVATKLSRGAEVEILDETAAGWVKLRSLQGGNIGWMSGNFLGSAG